MMTQAKRTLTNGSSSKRAKSSNSKRRMRSTTPRLPTTVNFGKQVLPKILRNTLTYVDNYAVTFSGAGLASFSFGANGPYDPQTAIGGHQPLGFDQIGALYDHWYVTGARFSLQPSYCSVDVPMQIACYVDDDTSYAGSFSSAAERPDARSMAVFVGDGATLPTLRLSYNSKKIFGAMSAGNPNLLGTNASNPAEMAYFAVVAEGGALLGAATATFLIKIEYDIEWTELSTFATS